MRGDSWASEYAMVTAYAQWLERHGWSTAQEIACYELRIDLVAWHDSAYPDYAVYEAKLQPSLAVMAQALRHRLIAPWVAVIVPVVSEAFVTVCQALGLGVVVFPPNADPEYRIPSVDHREDMGYGNDSLNFGP